MNSYSLNKKEEKTLLKLLGLNVDKYSVEKKSTSFIITTEKIENFQLSVSLDKERSFFSAYGEVVTDSEIELIKINNIFTKEADDMFNSLPLSVELDNQRTSKFTDADWKGTSKYTLKFNHQKIFNNEKNYLLSDSYINLSIYLMIEKDIELHYDDYCFLINVNKGATQSISYNKKDEFLALLEFDDNHRLTKNSKEIIELNYIY